MPTRPILSCLLLLALVPFGVAKDKQVLPNYVLQAQTVAVVILPDAGESITNSTANRTAEDNVEKALLQWGRYKVVPEITFADLVIAVRKGLAGGPTIGHSSTDDRPVIIQQPSSETTRVVVQQGTPPSTTFPEDPHPPASSPRTTIGREAGAAVDTFEVFLGKVDYPLDAAPVWRYMAKDALDGPPVQAVEQFQKAITQSEKAQKHKP